MDVWQVFFSINNFNLSYHRHKKITRARHPQKHHCCTKKVFFPIQSLGSIALEVGISEEYNTAVSKATYFNIKEAYFLGNKFDLFGSCPDWRTDALPTD